MARIGFWLVVGAALGSQGCGEGSSDGAAATELGCPCSGEGCEARLERGVEYLAHEPACVSLNPARLQCLSEEPGPGALPDETALMQASCVQNKGSGCDPAVFITVDAAMCIAGAAGLEPGLRSWTTGLVYMYGYRRVVWTVGNTLIESGGDFISGHVYAIDATTGIPVVAWAPSSID